VIARWESVRHATGASVIAISLGLSGNAAASPPPESAPPSAPEPARISHRPRNEPGERCGLGREEAVELILEAALSSDEGWRKITHLCDRIGHRLSGSPSLARAVDWAVEQMERDGLENVRRQPVAVPHWVRGMESATLVAPRHAELAMTGLGRSVATAPGGVTAPVVVVGDFDELSALGDEAVSGRIVLYNAPFTSYSETVEYRWDGPARAAAHGAAAVLMRSVTPRSLRTPHTGALAPWKEDGRRIPAAALAIEDADMIARLTTAGEEVRVRLEMEAHTRPDTESHNVIGEIVGRERPEEVVVIGGHIDSWDVGQGAQDNGGGCVASMEAGRILRELGLRPRRTVRIVLWTNEENGGRGAKAYRESVGDAIDRHYAAIEMDGGVERPWGFGVSVWRDEEGEADEPREARVLEALRELVPLLRPAGADSVRLGGGGADISPLMEAGVPGLALRNPMERYWDVHHSDADTVDKIDPVALRENIAALAAMAYLLADRTGSLD
jgi:Iap family predicted aminopeptidase